jgi:glucuronokinase
LWAGQDIPKPLQPQFILDVETQELFIQAGLQDRVIQIYEGMVYMDFNQAVMESQGYGIRMIYVDVIYEVS